MAVIQIYVDDKLKSDVEQVATKEDRSISYIVRKWIEQGLIRRNQARSTSSHVKEVFSSQARLQK